MARYPALDVHAIDPALVLAVADDFAPAAAEDHEDGVRVFFTHAEDRDHAGTALLAAYPAAQVVALEIDDEDWARRSQADLEPVTVGRITVVPRPTPPLPGPESQAAADAFTIVIRPSMGFGTGHHATTRLCLAALQRIDMAGKTLLDVGTGSGILAIAADRLGARSALGIDHDADAIAAARENVDLNPEVGRVRFEVVDLRATSLAPADVVVANLTGALLASAAPLLRRAVKDRGTLIVSGLLEDEEPAVREALAPAAIVWRGAEQGWVALALTAGMADG